MYRARFAALLAALLVAAVALAGTSPASWTPGVVAANADRVLGGLPGHRTIDLPDKLVSHLGKTTLIVYFSPECPHCQHAQPELNALAERTKGKLTIVGIATGSVREGEVAAYRIDYQVPYDLVWDGDHQIAAALGANATPSALLVRKRDDGKIEIVDGWYPYKPGQTTLIEMKLLDDPYKAFRPGVYQGNAVCAACHVHEGDSWQLTMHSIAYVRLVVDGKQDDPKCNRCHVTGAGQKTGWAGDPRSPLIDVGCEACHGPGGPHDGKDDDPKAACAGCHDPEHSIAFSYDKGLPLIDHFRATALDDKAWYAARTQLIDGDVPKDLLAFPEGDTVGFQACTTCHEDPHSQWAQGPHAKAMATLATDAAKAKDPPAATDPDCVRCHATAKQGGPPPTDLAGYRTDEGVGCEACHGPGEAHVKAEGGKDNIEGLGEDCPVCVLDAVCTRCHTKQWDPKWNLDAKLPTIKH